MGLFKKKIKKHEQINMTFSDININDDYHEPKIETKEISHIYYLLNFSKSVISIKTRIET